MGTEVPFCKTKSVPEVDGLHSYANVLKVKVVNPMLRGFYHSLKKKEKKIQAFEGDEK